VNEKTLVGQLKTTLLIDLPGSVVIKHADAFTSGVPDLSVTWKGKTSWLEIKYANPEIIERKIQNLMMKRLSIQGSAWYVIYDCVENRTVIVNPLHLETWRFNSIATAVVFNHVVVATFIRSIH